MDPSRGPDRALAERQWQSLRDAFADAGLTVHEIEPVADLEDMVFAANQVFVDPRGRFIVPSRMRYPSRQREVPYYVEWFERHGFETLDCGIGDETLEGHGDLLWHPGRPAVWAGHGFRSSYAAIERFARAMERKGVSVTPLELVDPNFYHLDTCLAPLSPDAALYYPGAFSPGAIEALAAGWTRLHAVTRDEALGFACNGVAVQGRFLVSNPSPRVCAMVEGEGLRIAAVDTSEFEKAGGSVFCLKTTF